MDIEGTIQEETAALLTAASEIVATSVTYEREGGDLIAVVYNDEGDIVDRRKVSIVIGDPA